MQLADVLATTVVERARLLELIEEPATATLIVDQALRALLGRSVNPGVPPAPLDPALLGRAGAAIARATSVASAMYATEALLLGSPPDEALRVVTPTIDLAAPQSSVVGMRTMGVLHATRFVRTWERDDGWIDLLCRAVLDPHHWPTPLFAFAAGPNDARIVAAVAEYARRQQGSYLHEGAWAVLHRSGDGAHAPLLARSLGTVTGKEKQTLDFIRASGNAAAAPLLRDWIGRSEKLPGYEAIVAEAKSVLAALGDTAPVQAKRAEDRHHVSTAEEQPMPPALEVQRRELEERCREAGIDVARVMPLVRHAITMRARSVHEIDAGASHLGGRPDLPRGTKWPTVAGYPLAFAMQIRLQDVAPFDVDGALPSAGLLSFFVADAVVNDGTLEYGAGKVLFFEEARELVAVDMPEPTRVAA